MTEFICRSYRSYRPIGNNLDINPQSAIALFIHCVLIVDRVLYVIGVSNYKF